MSYSDYKVLHIVEDTTRQEYAVRGHDPVTNRLWLAVTDEAYDGYNGDLILVEWPDGSYGIVLADPRTNLPARIHLHRDEPTSNGVTSAPAG